MIRIKIYERSLIIEYDFDQVICISWSRNAKVILKSKLQNEQIIFIVYDLPN